MQRFLHCEKSRYTRKAHVKRRENSTKNKHYFHTVGLHRTSRMPSDLFVDKIGTPRHVEGTPDAHRGVIQMSWTDARHMAAAVHFLVLLLMLVVVIGLKSDGQIDIKSEKADSNHVNWDIGSGAVGSWNNQLCDKYK